MAARFSKLRQLRRRNVFLQNMYLGRLYCLDSITKETSIKIGCASGFWGDSTVAARQLIHSNEIDYLVLDYLSEITMSLLTAAKLKNSEFGYAPDLVKFVLEPNALEIKKQEIKVITNAGGVNPHKCAEAVKQVCAAKGVHLKVGVVTGDDLMSMRGKLMKKEVGDASSGNPLPHSVNSINAYLGCGPIVSALRHGADVIITGSLVGRTRIWTS